MPTATRQPTGRPVTVDIPRPEHASPDVRAKAARLLAGHAIVEQQRQTIEHARKLGIYQGGGRTYSTYWVGGDHHVYDVTILTDPDGWTAQCTCQAATCCSHALAAALLQAGIDETPIPLTVRPGPPTGHPPASLLDQEAGDA